MFNTKNFVLEGSDIPSTWVFQYYLNLPEKLTGQDLKIVSIFNTNERTPSFCIYVDKTIMQYKFEPQSKWEVDLIKDRAWTVEDKDYWLSFRIGKTLLSNYNVKPIEYYNLIKEQEGEIKKLRIASKHMYGYFDKYGEVYKIYQPHSKKHKFHKVKPYLQGFDQLKFDQPYLVICSSLKDAMCLKGMGYNLEVLAPDSENTMIKPHIIEHLKKKYKKIITLFDNDDAGKAAIKKYSELYKLDGMVCPTAKDISDAMKSSGFKVVHLMIQPILKKILNK